MLLKNNLLLIEDDEVDIELFKRLIKKTNAPIELHVARNGIEALDKLYGLNNTKKLNPLPSLILLDINMPKINGFELLKILRNDPMLNDIKVAMLTHSNNLNDLKKAIKLNVNEYFTKPLKLDTFNYICEKLLH